MLLGLYSYLASNHEGATAMITQIERLRIHFDGQYSVVADRADGSVRTLGRYSRDLTAEVALVDHARRHGLTVVEAPSKGGWVTATT